VNNSVVSALLRIAKRPNTDPLRGRIEAHVVSTDEARTMLEHTSPDAPIIAQTGLMAWDPNRGRPIEQLLDMVVTRDAKLSIQIPSQPITETGQSFRKIKFSDAAARFLANEPSDNPWNVLDFGNPHGECTTPTFLAHGGCRNTRLLRDIKMELTNEGSAGRTVTAPTVEKYWTEVISWVLLSEGGNVTGPHTDAYGQATHISVQEGEVGFGWMSHPTDDVLGRWTESDSADEKAVHGVLSSATWRYVVLRPGQTVFFNTRTVHFVFRPKGPQTMAFGGHVLLWNNLLEWLRTVVWQLDNENVHNEDMSNCRSYVDAVAAMVRRKVRDKDTALMANGSMSGSQVASRFLKLKKVTLTCRRMVTVRVGGTWLTRFCRSLIPPWRTTRSVSARQPRPCSRPRKQMLSSSMSPSGQRPGHSKRGSRPARMNSLSRASESEETSLA